MFKLKFSISLFTDKKSTTSAPLDESIRKSYHKILRDITNWGIRYEDLRE